MTRKCPPCGGDGIVYSEASAAIDVERRVRSLVSGSRSQAYRVELSAPIAAALIGPGASRLRELETMTKRRFFLEGKPDTHLDHFVVLAEGKLADLAPKAAVEEAAELQVELVEVDRHDGTAAVGKLDGFDVCVAGAASLVGKRVKVRIERVLDGVAYATLVRRAGKKVPEPLTAEAEAEKPTRKPPARKTPGAAPEEGGEVEEADTEEEGAEEADKPPGGEQPSEKGAAAARKRTRRGSRGGKNRRKRTAAAGAAAVGGNGAEPAPADETEEEPVEAVAALEEPVEAEANAD